MFRLQQPPLGKEQGHSFESMFYAIYTEERQKHVLLALQARTPLILALNSHFYYQKGSS